MNGNSYRYFKQQIKQWVFDNFDEDITILDVGIGNGVYWDLLKEKTKNIDGVEIFKPNIDQHKGTKYRHIFNCDIKDFSYDHYDLIIFGDILEHLSVEDAQKVLDYAYDRCKNLIVALPYMYNQGPLYGNVYEEHKQSDLTPENVLERYPRLKLLYGNKVYGYYIKNN